MSDSHGRDDFDLEHSSPDIAEGHFGKPPAELTASPKTSGHPAGLWVLFITEMWERFSYYGMRALLVLYLVASVNDPENPGMGWTQEQAGLLYGIYTALVYLTPIFGGILADLVLGTHRSVLIGGWIIAAGHFCLALTELFGHGSAATGTFIFGLLLIIIGTGFFKPCVSVMVGQLYAEDDHRRDSAFTIFYMGINVGAFLSGVVAGTLGEVVGWHWGFGSAGVGMVLGLFVYQALRPKYLKGIGLPPGHSAPIEESKVASKETERPFGRIDFDRMLVILVLSAMVVFFWAAFEQAGTSMNLFAYEKTDRNVMGFEFPATWYQSVNPLYIVIFAPIFAWFWMWLDKRGLQPRTPVKFAFGLMMLGFGFAFMILASLESANRPFYEVDIKGPDGQTRIVALDAATGDLHQGGVPDSFMLPPPEEESAADDAASESEDEQDSGEDEVPTPEDISGAMSDALAELQRIRGLQGIEVYSSEDGTIQFDATWNLDGREVTVHGDARGAAAALADLSEIPGLESIRLSREDDEVYFRALLVIDDEATRVEGPATQAAVLQRVSQRPNFAEAISTLKEEAGGGEIGVVQLREIPGRKSGPHWLLLAYLLHTWGELCLSPVGLSMVTKLAHVKIRSLMMGVWFVSNFVSNIVAGLLFVYSAQIAESRYFAWMLGDADFYMVLLIAPVLAGLFVLLISPFLKRMMHGLH